MTARLPVLSVASVCYFTALTAFVSSATVTSNIDPAANSAWSENAGWINFRGQGTGDEATPPPVIGPNGFSGYAWAENLGWINLGDGTNTDPNGFGVLVDSGTGQLSGYAWAENAGWVNFGTGFAAAGVAEPDRPTVSLTTGEFTGYAWGENIGWINLDGSSVDPQAQVVALPPTASQIAAGLVGVTAVPLFSDRQPDGAVDAADVVTRVIDGFP
jgi:hypothetical protein